MSDALDAYNKECEPLVERLNHMIAPIENSIANKLDRSLGGGFFVPLTIHSHDSYDEEIAGQLYQFLEYVKNKPALMQQNGLVEGIQENVELILNALRDERRGETERAREKIRDLLVKYRDNPFFVSDLDKSYAFRGIAPFPTLRDESYDYSIHLETPLTFFRCRGGHHLERKEMLHIPLNKRSQIGSCRFSLSGIPCLYLSTTTFCCWNELLYPSEMSASAFRPNERGKHFKILNLTISPWLIHGMDRNVYDPMSELVKCLWQLFPLTLAVSAHVVMPQQCGYRPEYTISHLIMRCLKELKLDGVAFLSTRCGTALQFPHNVNLAIPVFIGAEKNANYGEICSGFEMTDPITIIPAEPYSVDSATSKSYLNTVYDTGIHATIVTPYGRVPYGTTLFGKTDDLLSGQSFFALQFK